jgi:hypothetical protein
MEDLMQAVETSRPPVTRQQRPRMDGKQKHEARASPGLHFGVDLLATRPVFCQSPASDGAGPKADMGSTQAHIRFAPNSDIDCV